MIRVNVNRSFCTGMRIVSDNTQHAIDENPQRILCKAGTCSDFVTDTQPRFSTASIYRKTTGFPGQPSPRLQIIRGPELHSFVRRVLTRLEQREVREADPWLRDDLHVAWLTVLRASEGTPNAWEYSFWAYYGTTHQQALEHWARRDQMREEIFREWERQSVAEQAKPVQSRLPFKKEGAA